MEISKHLADLDKLASSGDRVRIGYTLSNGRAVKLDVMDADSAKIALLSAVDTADVLGFGITSITLWRIEDAMGVR